MTLEYGLDRYGELLRGHFIDNKGPQGSPGPSNRLVAVETREKFVSDDKTYRGLLHRIAPHRLTPRDIIICNFWFEPWNLPACDITVRWRTNSGRNFDVFTDSSNSNQHYIFSFMQDAGNTSRLIGTTYNSFQPGGVTTHHTQILNPDGSIIYDWIVKGGSVAFNIVTGAAVGFAGVDIRAYYYHMRI